MSVTGYVFVTGGNRGIGRGLVEQLSKTHKVYYSARSKSGDLPSVGTCVVMDVQDEKSVADAAASIDGTCGLLINNAGISGEKRSGFMDTSIEDTQNVLDVNVLGPLRVCKAFIPKMHPGSRILNISSTMGQLTELSGSRMPSYRMSKTALNSLTKILSVELEAKNISVNSVCPGWVQTDMGGSTASWTVEESAKYIVELALRPDFPNGQFLRRGEQVPW